MFGTLRPSGKYSCTQRKKLGGNWAQSRRETSKFVKSPGQVARNGGRQKSSSIHFFNYLHREKKNRASRANILIHNKIIPIYVCWFVTEHRYSLHFTVVQPTTAWYLGLIWMLRKYRENTTGGTLTTARPPLSSARSEYQLYICAGLSSKKQWACIVLHWTQSTASYWCLSLVLHINITDFVVLGNTRGVRQAAKTGHE